MYLCYFPKCFYTAVILFLLPTLLSTTNLCLAQNRDDSLSINALTEMSLEELMQIEVTVNKFSEKSFEASGTVYVIREEDIKRRGYKDLKDILVEIPGIGFAGYTGDVDMTRVRVRGISENMKIMVLRDGIKLNNPSNSPLTWGNNIPLHNVEQIEIVIGPASVIYGQNTYSALVNMKTKKTYHYSVEMAAGSFKTYVPAFSISQPFATKGNIYISGRSYLSEGYNRYKQYPEMYKSAVDDWKNKVANSDEKFNARDLMTNAFVQDYNFQIEAKYGKFYLGGMFNGLKEVNSLPHNPELYFVNHRSPIQTVQGQAYAKFITEIGEKWESQSTATYIQEIRGFEYGFTYLDDPTSYDPGDKKYFNSYDEAIRLEHQMVYSYSQKLIFNFGGIFEDIISVPQETNFFTQIDPKSRIKEDAYYFQLYGGFVQTTWKPLNWLKLVGGARLDYSTNFKESFNPRIAAIFFPTSKLTIKLMHGQAYLAPSAKDMFFINPAPHSTQIANPDLNPEHITTHELSFQYKIAKNVLLKANFYHNDAKDIVALVLIDTDSTGFQTRQNRNINKLESYGGELTITAFINNKWQINGWYAYLDGHTGTYNETDNYVIGDRLIQVANHKGNIGITYLLNRKIGIHLNGHCMGKIKTNDLNEKYHGGYMPTMINVDLNINAQQVWHHFDISLQVKNLLNQKQYHLESRGYDIRIPEVPQPLMNFLVTVRYNFE